MATHTVKQTGGDFSTLASALSDAGTGTGDTISIEGTWTVADTAAATVSDTNITIQTDADSKVDPTNLASPSHYRLRHTGSSHCITVNQTGCTIDGLEIQQGTTQAGSGTSDECVRFGTSGTLTVKNTVVWALQRVSDQDGIYTSGSSGNTVTINGENVTGFGFGRTLFQAQQFSTSGTYTINININSCTGYDSGDSGELDGASLVNASGRATGCTHNINIFNSIGLGSSNVDYSDGHYSNGTKNWDIHNSIDSDNSIASRDTGGVGNLASRTATDSTSPGAGNWVMVQDITGSVPWDLTLQDDATNNDAQEMHTAASGAGMSIPSTDLEGDTRSSSYDCGFDTIAAGGTTTNIGLSTETDSAFGITALKNQSFGLASETNSAFALSALKARAIGLASETDTALDISPTTAIVTKTVGASGADYITVQGALDWFVANHNYGTGGIARVQIIDSGTYTFSTTYSLNLTGTPSSTAYLEITSTATEPIAGPVINCTQTAGAAFVVTDVWTYIHNVEFQLNTTSTDTRCIRILGGSDDVLISRCNFVALNQANDQDAIYAGAVPMDASIDHCTFVGFGRGAIASIHFSNDTETQTWSIDHCSMAVGTTSGELDGGAISVRRAHASNTFNFNVYNTLAFVWSGTSSSDLYNENGTSSTVNYTGSANIAEDASVEAKYTSSYNSVTFTETAPTSGENAWLTEIDSATETAIDLDIAGENTFTVTQNGVDRTGSEPDARQDFSTDIMGNARGATPTIGAFENAAGFFQAIGLASETDTALAKTWSKGRSIGLASETDTAFVMARLKGEQLGLSSEADTAFAMAHARILQLALAAETDTAFAMTSSAATVIGLSTETDTAFPITTSAATPIGLSVETDSAFALGRAKAEAIALASETDSAFPILYALGRQIGLASEADTAQAFTHKLAVAMGLASETDSALQFLIGAGVQIGIAAETDTGFSFGSAKNQAIGLASETDSGQVIAAVRDIALLLASETDSALAMTFSAGVSIGLAQETDTALAVSSAKTLEIAIASETDSAQAMPPTRLIPVQQALETDSAFIMDYSRAVSMGLASETDSAFVVTPIGALVVRPEGLQYTLPENRLHFTLPVNRLHYVLKRGH